MQTRRTLLLSIAAATAMLGLGRWAAAAVQDMSEPELTSRADLIVTGRIVGVKAKTARPDWVSGRDDISFWDRLSFTDITYTVTLDVASVQKGKAGGKQITFTGWRAVKRPEGWAGPGGTIRDQPLTGQMVKAYLENETGAWRLMSPSGFQWLCAPERRGVNYDQCKKLLAN